MEEASVDHASHVGAVSCARSMTPNPYPFPLTHARTIRITQRSISIISRPQNASHVGAASCARSTIKTSQFNPFTRTTLQAHNTSSATMGIYITAVWVEYVGINTDKLQQFTTWGWNVQCSLL